MAKSNFSTTEKTLTNRRGPQRFWMQWNGSASAKSLRTTALCSHPLRYSQSDFPFFLFVAKMNATENENSNHLAVPRLPAYTMVQLLRWFNCRSIRHLQLQAHC